MGRRLVGGTAPTDGATFGRWDMDSPHLHGIFAKGWITDLNANSGLRCTYFGAPPMANGDYASQPAAFAPTEFWHGNFLYVGRDPQ